MENAPVGFQMFELVDKNDLGSFTFRATNIECGRQTGMDMKQFIGQSIREAMPDVLNMNVLHLYEEALISKKTVDLGVVEYGDKKVNLGHYKVEVYHIDNKHVGVIFNNITAQIEAETRLKKKIAEVEENAREMEEITYIASHDLQEPLTTIKSMTEWLRQRYEPDLDEQGKKGVNFVIQSVSRMKVLIMDLMDFSRIGQDVMPNEKIDIRELLEDMISDLASAEGMSEAKVTVGEMPTINGYRTGLRLLFQNLISNSLKFRADNIQPAINIESKETETHWQFSVKDNGIGIEKKYLKEIFSIFQRLHSRDEYEGTGIGLAHCRKVIELHEGKIWVESKVGKGSTFYFTIAKKRLR